MKQKKSKKVEAPAVVHGSSDKAQGEHFRDACDKTAHAFNRVQHGKGSRPRTSLNNPLWRSNYDEINWGSSKPENN